MSAQAELRRLAVNIVLGGTKHVAVAAFR
jgi:hypothetical protein